MSAISPSMTAETRPCVRDPGHEFTAPSLDMISPTWRFSNQSLGRRSTWRTRLPVSWKLSRCPKRRRAQPRKASISDWMTTRAPNPKRDDKEQVVVSGDRLINDELHLERRDEAAAWSATSDSTSTWAERRPGAVSRDQSMESFIGARGGRRLEALARCYLEDDAGEVGRELGQR